MAEFVTVMREFERMCSHSQCEECEWSGKQGIGGCAEKVVRYPKEAETIIMSWAAEHPVETMKDRFFKMFPDALRTTIDTPNTCPFSLGWGNGQYCRATQSVAAARCIECWNQPWEGEDDG